MRQQESLLALGEMLQELMIELQVEGIAEVVAQTALASADAEADKDKRALLLWYGRQFRKLAQGPPAGVGERLPRPVGRAALEQAFHRLILRANRMSTALPPVEGEWAETLYTELQRVAERLS